jgi:hypothetical protein
MRLAVIVPYRNRPQHLRQFVPHIRRYLDFARVRDYSIHIIEQAPGKRFNRGIVKNIGFKLAEASADYVCFHDVDYLPVEANYSPVDCPTLLISKGITLDENLDLFLGGVVAFPNADFIKVNGYPNAYWSWGFEDVELRERCVLNGLAIKRREGVFRALPHVHEGQRPDGTPTDEARGSRELYLGRKPYERHLMGLDGLSSVSFNLLGAQTEAEFHHYRVEF